MTLGDLEEGFDAMQKRLRKVGRGSEEFQTLTTAMAQTTAEIKNIELGFEGLDREQVASELGSVAGGIGDITASLVLLGGENETIEQIGASIEKAMAISMGFKGAIEGLSSARKLHNNLLKDGTIQQVKETITTSIATAKTWLLDGAKKAYAVTTGVLTGKIKIATVAQRVFNAVLKANPIAILITTIAAAGAAYLAFAKDTSKAAKEQKALQDSLEAVSGELESVYEEVNKVENAFDLASKGVISKEEALKTYNETIGQTIGEAETLEEAEQKFSDNTGAYLEAAIARAQAQELIKMAAKEQTEALLASEEDNRTWYESTVGFINDAGAAFADYSTLGVFGLSEASDKLNDKLKEGATERLVNEKEANALSYKELAKSLNEKAALIETNNNFITEADRKEKDKQDKIDDEAKKEADRKAKERADAWEAGAADRAMARSKEQQAKKDALMEDIEIADRNLELDTEELDRNSILIEGLLSNEQILHDAKNFWHNKDLERIAEENAARREAAQDAMNLALTTLNAISDVSNTRADEDLKAEEERFNTLRATTQLTEKQIAAEEANSAKIKDDIRKRQFENDKKMQIAMAAINGAQALTSIFAQYPKFDGGFAMVAALASSVITTAATIAKIKATTFQSTPAPALPAIDSGDGGPTGPDAGGGAAITPVSNTSTILGGQKVFVTETDITETQNNVSVIEESATF
jgi:hypothetical protein